MENEGCGIIVGLLVSLLEVILALWFIISMFSSF